MNLIDFVPIPYNWRSNGKYPMEVEITPSCYPHEYFYIINIIQKSICERNLKAIVRVENAYLYGRYLLRRAEYALKSEFTELTLLHSTPAENIQSIINDNLDWRLVARYKFGRGISFSPHVSYADREGCRYTNNQNRAMIVAKVLISQSYIGYPTLKIPQGGFDTTTDNNYNVFVKYQDDEFYPEYVIYYEGET